MGSNPSTLMEVGIMVKLLQTLYLLSNERVVALKEEDVSQETIDKLTIEVVKENIRTTSDFGLTNSEGVEDRDLVVLERAMPAPIDNILDPARYKISADRRTLEPFPGYIDVPTRIANAKNAEIQAIDKANTIEALKTVLKQQIEDKYAERK